MTRLTTLTLALSATLLAPVAVVPTVAHATEHPHCNTYTSDLEAGVTCTNPTNKAYDGKLVVECVNLQDMKRMKLFNKTVAIPPNSENVLESVTCPVGTKPLPPVFTGPNEKK